MVDQQEGDRFRAQDQPEDPSSCDERIYQVVHDHSLNGEGVFLDERSTGFGAFAHPCGGDFVTRDKVFESTSARCGARHEVEVDRFARSLPGGRSGGEGS